MNIPTRYLMMKAPKPNPFIRVFTSAFFFYSISSSYCSPFSSLASFRSFYLSSSSSSSSSSVVVVESGNRSPAVSHFSKCRPWILPCFVPKSTSQERRLYHYPHSHLRIIDARMVLRYELLQRFDRGSCGDVWLAFHKNYSHRCSGSDWSQKNKKYHFHSKSHDRNLKINFFILKFITADRGTSIYLSGMREKYFGEIFFKASTFSRSTLSGFHDPGCRILEQKVLEEGLNHIGRYIEYSMTHLNQICLVFHHEGVSLSKLMYTDNADEENNDGQRNVHPLQPSKWWHWLKITEEGQEEMRSLIWQLLMALKSCHDRNITHRDIKLANMVVCFEDLDTGWCSNEIPVTKGSYRTRMRIIDFGSAIDEYTINHLYGSAGPSSAEQTYEYAPPEALLNRSWYKGPVASTMKYDMWSVGVVMLEMILGSPNVFQINSFARILLDRQLAGWSEGLKVIVYRLRSLMEFCILCVGDSSKHCQHETTNNHEWVSPAPWKCSEEFFSFQVRNRDPLRLGFPNVWALRLVRQLLLWDPEERLSVDDAMKHPYFHQPLLQT